MFRADIGVHDEKQRGDINTVDHCRYKLTHDAAPMPRHVQSLSDPGIKRKLHRLCELHISRFSDFLVIGLILHDNGLNPLMSIRWRLRDVRIKS